jgi:protein-arginine kinase activator protein McsA
MPIYKLVCPKCGQKVKKLAKAKPDTVCTKCFVLMERQMAPPDVQVKEVLDNGAMPRKVERFKDAEQLFRDRAKRDD